MNLYQFVNKYVLVSLCKFRIDIFITNVYVSVYVYRVIIGVLYFSKLNTTTTTILIDVCPKGQPIKLMCNLYSHVTSISMHNSRVVFIEDVTFT